LKIPSDIGGIPVTRRAIGISWFNESDYPEVLRIMVDAHVLPRTFRDWQEKATKQFSQLEAEGFKVFRAVIDPKSFPGWCAMRGLDIDAKARTRFASEYAARQITSH
jgi:hypothetical protein